MQRLANIRNLIRDMDGVLYRENTPMPGLVEFFDFLRQRGIRYVLATNNSTRTPEQYVNKMAGMGVQITPTDLITSAQATAACLRGIAPPGTPVYAIGQAGLMTALGEAGFVLTDHRADLVVVGMDLNITYDKLRTATLLIRGGATFIGTNPDVTLPTPEGFAPGTGAILAALQAATGITPLTIGKPEPTMYEQAMARLGATPADTAALGDRLETDIVAAQRTGILSLLVLTGVTDRAMLGESSIRPDLVFEDIEDLQAQWARL
ncbi:MAG: HAD family hydrolase [Anaerolineae bacterium]|nr:MAG: HAD family hydrolase [Anaerolineae bacterium]